MCVHFFLSCVPYFVSLRLCAYLCDCGASSVIWGFIKLLSRLSADLIKHEGGKGIVGKNITASGPPPPPPPPPVCIVTHEVDARSCVRLRFYQANINPTQVDF